MNKAAQIYLLKKFPQFVLREELIFEQIFLNFTFQNSSDENGESHHYHYHRPKFVSSAESKWEEFVKTDTAIAAFLLKNANLVLETTEILESWREKFGIKTLTPFDFDYPQSFRNMKNSPWLLYYKGQPIWHESEFLSVVGSREMTSESAAWMETHLGDFLHSTEAGLVSGGARGVDMKAHQLCLRMQRPTVAFLPSGFLQMYPSDFEYSSLSIIERGGAIVSEYEPNKEMRKQYFYARNRLIANLGLMTLIIQAQKRSGTMLTAQHAVENSKPLFVLPAHPQSPLFSGNLKLLSEGATMLCDAQELSSFFASEVSMKTLSALHLGVTRMHTSAFSAPM